MTLIIAEILYPLKSAIKPRKQTRFAGDPVSSVKTMPARRTRSHPPKWTIEVEDWDLLIPIELSQSRADSDLNQDLGGDLSVVSPRESHQSEETLPTVPLGQFQAQRSDNTTTKSIAHFQTETPSQSEINSTITENIVENIVTFQTDTPSQREIFSETGTGTSSSEDVTHSDGDTPEEHLHQTGTQSTNEEASESRETATSSQSEIFSGYDNSSNNNSDFETYTSSQSEITTEYDTSSEPSSREASRPSSPESGNLSVRTVYSPTPEMGMSDREGHGHKAVIYKSHFPPLQTFLLERHHCIHRLINHVYTKGQALCYSLPHDTPQTWDQVPPLDLGTPPQHSEEHLIHGGRYASCVHAGGLSCWCDGLNRTDIVEIQ